MAKQRKSEDFENYNPPNIEERILTASQEMPFSEKSELGEAFGHLDNDSINEQSGFSNIDFNARLSQMEINNCIVFDELKAKGLLPFDANITLQKKRMSVSLGGKGREEKVQIASGQREATLAGKSGGMLSKLFSKRE